MSRGASHGLRTVHDAAAPARIARSPTATSGTSTQIVLADRLGFREAWVGEHLTERWENAPAPDLLLAQALALTKRIKLGTGVTLLALHNPVYLAHRLAMLDHMARGRFQWGIGGGAIPTDLSLFGLDRATPRPCGRAPPRCSTSCSSSGPPRVSSRYHGKFFDIDTPVFDPGQGPRLLHEAVPAAASAHRGRGQHARLELDADGRASAAGFPCRARCCRGTYLSRPLASGRGRRRRAPAVTAERSEWRVARDMLVATHAGGGARAGARGHRAKLRAAPASQPRGHQPDDVDQARAVHARRGRDGRLPDGERVDRRRSLASARRRSTSSTRRAAASARCSRSRPTRTMPAGTTRACAS